MVRKSAGSCQRDIDARLVEVLEKSGFEVAALKGMGITRSVDMGKVEPAETYRLAKEVARSEADGTLISCGNLRAFEATEPLEN